MFVRILVDGYSLLHEWSELAPGQARYSDSARAALVTELDRYAGASAVPVTVVFDGTGSAFGTPSEQSRPEMEIIFSGNGRTADDVIERVVARLLEYGSVAVVTDDRAERGTVESLGGVAYRCRHFIDMLRNQEQSFGVQIRDFNTSERDRYHKAD